MNCSKLKQRLSVYYDSELSPDVAAEVAAHLADCSSCTAELASFSELSDISRRLTDPPVPTHIWEELEAKLRGEKTAPLSDRAGRIVTRLRALNGNVALFSHGHFGRVLGAKWIGLSVAQSQHLKLDTASLSVLSYEHDRIEEPVIALWNCTEDQKLT